MSTDKPLLLECRYELFSRSKRHYCHLPREHEGEHEWFYDREQVKKLIAARLAEREAVWKEVVEAAQATIEWENEYRTLNNLGRWLATALSKLQASAKEGR